MASLGPEHDELIQDLAHGVINEEEFLAHLLGETHLRVIDYLEEAAVARSLDSLSRALLLSYSFTDTPGLAPAMARLLRQDWHTFHEDIVFSLRWARDSETIDAVYGLAENIPAYLAWDDNFALSRKCTWTLFKIGTPEALAKLRLLAGSKIPAIREFAQERLIDAAAFGEDLDSDARQVLENLEDFSFADEVRQHFEWIVSGHDLWEETPRWRGPEGRAVAFSDGIRFFEFVVEYPTGYVGATVTRVVTPPGGAQRSFSVRSRLEDEKVIFPLGVKELFQPGHIEAILHHTISWIRRHEDQLFHVDWIRLLDVKPQVGAAFEGDLDSL